MSEHQSTISSGWGHWVLVFVVAIIGAATSAMGVSWNIGGQLEGMRHETIDIKARMDITEKTTNKNATAIAALIAREDDADRYRIEMSDRLKEINAKIDTITVILIRADRRDTR